MPGFASDAGSVYAGSWFGTLNGYAASSNASASAAAASLSSLISPFTTPTNVTFTTDTSKVTMAALPSVTVPTYTPPNATFPSAISLEPINVSLTRSAPTLSVLPPTISIPTAPDVLSVSAPISTFLPTTFLFPIAPIVAIPDLPSLNQMVVPQSIPIAIPTFTQILPTNDSSIPSISYNFDNASFQDSLLDLMKVKLATRLDGGTGLSPVVEEAIWNRERDRSCK